MSYDILVSWKKRKMTLPEAQAVVRQFFDAAATSIEWDPPSRVLEYWKCQIVLQGKWSWPFEGMEPRLHRYTPMEGHSSRRHIELSADPNGIVVTTRMADDYTNVVASGLAEMFARYWEGKVDRP